MVAAAPVPRVVLEAKPKASVNLSDVEPIKSPESPKLDIPDLKSTGGRLSVAWGAVCEIGKDICKLVSERADRHKASVAVGQLKSLESLTSIDLGSPPKERDKQWTDQANKFRDGGLPLLASHLEILKGPAAQIELRLKTQVETLLTDAKDVFAKVRPEGNLTIQDFLGQKAEATVASLTPDERKRFLAAYDTLRSVIPDLKASFEELGQVPIKLNEQAIALVKSDASFAETFGSLHKGAKDLYELKRQAILDAHSKAHSSDSGPVSPSQAIAAGDVALAALTKIQVEVQELSKSLSAAEQVSGKLETTLSYLTNGIPQGKALAGATDTSVVLVSADAADAIANWVTQKTRTAVTGLNDAKASNDPKRIAEAAIALDAVSGKVHEQLADVAGLLSKINKGVDTTTGTETGGLRERIIAKAKEGGRGINRKNANLLKEYISAVDEKLTGLVKEMFSTEESLQPGRRKLAEFVVKNHRSVEALITADTQDSDGLTTADIKEALSKAKRDLDETPKAKSLVEKNEEKLQQQIADELKSLEPKQKESWYKRAWNSFWG